MSLVKNPTAGQRHLLVTFTTTGLAVRPIFFVINSEKIIRDEALKTLIFIRVNWLYLDYLLPGLTKIQYMRTFKYVMADQILQLQSL